MRIDRRTFLKMAGSAGVIPFLPFGSSTAYGAQLYDGPFFLMVNAGGGWDPIFLADPKTDTTLDRMSSGIGTAGNIRYADIPVDLEALNMMDGNESAYTDHLKSNKQFFDRWGSELVVVNGIDTSTNNHDAGNRTAWCGRIPVGYPAFGALVAAALSDEAAMPFISGGGYDATQGLVPLTRVTSAADLPKLANPNLINPGADNDTTYHSESTRSLIEEVREQRFEMQMAKQRLPKIKRSYAALQLARVSDDILQYLELPENLVTIPGGGLNDLQGMMQQTQISLSAFRSGMAVSASVTLGGFDTHANHDVVQVRQLAKLRHGVHFALEEAARMGIADRLVLIAASDFGRGPYYNGEGAGSGKDHWPITSMFVRAPNMRGNRVVGGTNDEQRARQIDPVTMLPKDGTGVKVTPSLVHTGLRKLAGIHEHELSAKFPLLARDLPLFV